MAMGNYYIYGDRIVNSSPVQNTAINPPTSLTIPALGYSGVTQYFELTTLRYAPFSHSHGLSHRPRHICSLVAFICHFSVAQAVILRRAPQRALNLLHDTNSDCLQNSNSCSLTSRWQPRSPCHYSQQAVFVLQKWSAHRPTRYLINQANSSHSLDHRIAVDQ
jgi:hypothetical protein